MSPRTIHDAAMVAAGYVRCPNRPARWYAGGPGIMEAPQPLEIRLSDDYGPVIVVAPYGKFNEGDMVPVLRFTDVDDLTRYLSKYGTPSPGGLAAFSNAWD